MIRATAIFISSVVFTLSAAALALPAVARIDLSNCRMTGASQFSGVLVRFGPDTYVVTTSWAQLSATTAGPRCERIYIEGGEVRATPLATDHLAGLAAYRLETSIPIEAPVTSTAAAIAMLENKIETINGAIVIRESPRHLLPAWERVLEWRGPQVTAETLGAGVWKDSILQGLVSHQYLQIVPGAKTRVRRWDLSSKELPNHLVVISAANIATWLERQVSHPQEPVVWLAEYQRVGIDRWTVGELELIADCPSVSDPDPGGHYPIGGNDGFGIGGDSVMNKACRVQISKSPMRSAWMPTSLQKWHDHSTDDLENGVNITMWYALTRNNFGPAGDYFYSNESFIKLALEDARKWVDVRQKPVPSELVELDTSAVLLREDVLRCYRNFYIRDANAQELVRRLFFVSLMTRSEVRRDLSVADVNLLMDLHGPFAVGWRTLSWVGACDTPKLRATAEAFAEVHRKVTSP